MNTGMRRFKRRSVIVEALQHDGTLDRASKIVSWIKDSGGIAEIMEPEDDYREPPVYYVKVKNERALTIVPPGFWVDKVESGHFYIVSDDDFRHLYDSLDAATTAEEDSYD